MAIRIENQYEGKLPKGAVEQIEEAFDSLPREHTRGIERIRLVPYITDPRIKGPFQATELPGLYHPRQGPKAQEHSLQHGVQGGRDDQFSPFGAEFHEWSV